VLHTRTATGSHVGRVIQNTFLPEVGRGARHGSVDDHALVLTGRSWERAATYAQRIKKKTAKTRAPARRVAAKAAPVAAPKPEPAVAPKPAPPPVASGELQRLRDELQRVNQELSRIGRVTRPDAARQTHLPEKQELLRQKADLDRKMRAVSKT
jgi:hypothetical protein